MARTPGGVTERTIVERNILVSMMGLQYARGRFDEAKSFDGANANFEDELREGTLLGIITASNLWRPCPRTTVTPAGGANAADVPVVDARAFIIGDIITVGGDVDKIVSSVNYATNVISLAGGAFVFANSEPVFGQDGSAAGRGVLYEFIKFKDRQGVRRRQESGKIIISGGILANAMMLGDLAAILADAGNKLGGVKWGNDYAGAAVQ